MVRLYRKANLRNFLFFLWVLSLASCTVVKNYQPGVPFVYKNVVSLKGEVPKDEQKRLEAELYNYFDDSLKPQPVSQVGVFLNPPPIAFYRVLIKNPPRFDSSNINTTIEFMQSYLRSQGYYSATIFDTTYMDKSSERKRLKEQGQQRTAVEMHVDVHKNLKIASYTFDSIAHDDLRQLARADSASSFLKANRPFTKQTITSELDRLVSLYRNNGYLRFSRDNLYAEVDTLDEEFLTITLDPFEQARLIAEATERRRENPTIDVAIRLRPSAEANALKKYYVGKIFLYPETERNEIVDSLIDKKFPIEIDARYYRLKQHVGLVKLRPLREHTYLREGTLYDERMYYKTINAYSSMGTWNQVDVRPILKEDTVPVVDFHFFLTPDRRYSFGTDFEISRNTGSIIAGNLLGIANVITLRNRNVMKQAIQASTTLRNGIELGLNDTSSVLQTFQSSITQTFSIPRILPPLRLRRTKRFDDFKTLISLNGSFTDRRDFFRLISGVLSYGYEVKMRNKVFHWSILNLELYKLDTLQGLRQAFVTNPFLRTAFNTGYVVSQIGTFSWSFPGRRPGVTHLFRVSAEDAGFLTGRLFPGLRDKIYQYIKGEVELRKLITLRKTGWAFRVFGGIGYNYSNDPVLGQSLPFYKQYIGGGPNSMRAWGIRQIGLGSSLLSDTSSIFRDRFGDVQLEANAEYRYPLFNMGSVRVHSALFTDIGNLWNLKNPQSNPNSALRFDRFWRDIAIAAGTGLRFEITGLMVRVDFAYKVKDPARLENGGWMSIRNFKWTNDEFRITDAAGRVIRRNNYAIQLGIGLPF